MSHHHHHLHFHYNHHFKGLKCSVFVFPSYPSIHSSSCKVSSCQRLEQCYGRGDLCLCNDDADYDDDIDDDDDDIDDVEYGNDDNDDEHDEDDDNYDCMMITT